MKNLKRKTPIRHNVRSHTREGKQVRSFARGRGIDRPKIARRKLAKATDKSVVERARTESPYLHGEFERLVAKSDKLVEAGNLNESRKVYWEIIHVIKQMYKAQGHKYKGSRPPAIRTTILKKLADGKPHTLADLTAAVKKSGYQSRTDEGQFFAKHRTHEALYRLIHTEKKVTKPKRNVYRLKYID